MRYTSHALVEARVICYAFMQAVGMVNDHLVTCFRHRQVRKGGRR
jgi:DNA-3-methyladenine glycosylase I